MLTMLCSFLASYSSFSSIAPAPHFQDHHHLDETAETRTDLPLGVRLSLADAPARTLALHLGDAAPLALVRARTQGIEEEALHRQEGKKTTRGRLLSVI